MTAAIRKEAVKADERAAGYRLEADFISTRSGERLAAARKHEEEAGNLEQAAERYRTAGERTPKAVEAYRREAEALKEISAAYRKAADEVAAAYRKAADEADEVAETLTKRAAGYWTKTTSSRAVRRRTER